MTRASYALLALSCLCPAVEAATLGRLFFTQEERRAIEQATARREPPFVKHQGQIRYPDGRIEYWLDGKPASHPPPAGLKIGDQFDHSSKTVQALLGSSRIEQLPAARP